jgi:hypothetical protein
MTNETDNATANETSTNKTSLLDTVEESGLLDDLMASPELLAVLAVIGVLVAYILYTEPKVRNLVFPLVNKYLKRYDAQIEALLEDNLTKAQMSAYFKLDEILKTQVKNDVLRNVVLTAWDEKDDELKALVKGKIKTALNNAR